jgi:hypothetical protein
MKFLTSIVLIIVLSFAAYLFANETPWWLFALGAFIAGWVVPQHPFKSWLSGFLAVFVLWLAQVYLADNANNSIMSAKMAGILPLNGSSVGLMLISAFIGGIVSGMASLTGAFMRNKPSK